MLPSQESALLLDRIQGHGCVSLGYRVLYTRGKKQRPSEYVKYQAIFFSAIDVGGSVLTPELAPVQKQKAHQKPFYPVAWEIDDPLASILKAKSQTIGAHWIQEDELVEIYVLS
jgi:hypothetical protein